MFARLQAGLKGRALEPHGGRIGEEVGGREGRLLLEEEVMVGSELALLLSTVRRLRRFRRRGMARQGEIAKRQADLAWILL
jgi:hypothetical protein